MRTLGILYCSDCGEQHEIHVNQAGQLVVLVSCTPARSGELTQIARRQLRNHLIEARDELNLAAQMFTATDVHYRQLLAQLDEALRNVVRAQNTIQDHLRG